MKRLHETRNFWSRWLKWNFFGLQLPSLIALSLFLFLLVHISFEVCGIVREAMRVKCESPLILAECGRDPVLRIVLTILKDTISVIGSSTVRNLNLLLAASIGWFFLYWRSKTADLNAEAAERSAITAEKVLTAEQITRAIEQLSHEKPSVRLGGVLGLEQVALNQKQERVKIARILVSFIRTRARKNSEETKKDLTAIGISDMEASNDFSAYREQRLDVEAAISALANITSELEKQGQFGRKYNESKKYLCDLQNTDLRGLQFHETNLSNFNFKGTDFSGAQLHLVNLTKANISFVSASAPEKENITKFIRTSLLGTNFGDTYLFGVKFNHSNLSYAKFDNARLNNASFDKCSILGTHFENSKNLTQKQIDKAVVLDDGTPPVLPKGLKPPQTDNHDQSDNDIT